MSVRLYVASSNPGKLSDFRAAAQAHDLAIEPLPNLKQIEPPIEDGATFEANAILKACYYTNFAPGQLVLADDSGIAADALGGEPGVRSARFSLDEGRATGHHTALEIDRLNNELLLEKMVGIPAEKRTIRYRAVLALARDGQVLFTAQGAVEGILLDAPRGTGGFGYDPLFFLPELNQTMAETDLATKHTLSHRGRAFAQLLQQLTAAKTA